MLREEFDEKYEMKSIMEENSRFMIVDVLILDGLAMFLIFMVLISRDLLVTTLVGVSVVVLGTAYWLWREREKNFVLDNNFIDLGVFCGDGILNYQYMLDKYEILRDGEWVCINDAFILDTTAMFKGGYDIHESILSFVDDTSVLTKYGVGKAPCVIIMTTYEGEYELDEKVIPVLMIRLTGPVAMELSK